MCAVVVIECFSPLMNCFQQLGLIDTSDHYEIHVGMGLISYFVVRNLVMRLNTIRSRSLTVMQVRLTGL